ncbi:MAG: hypothetical protein N4A57_10670 [Anaeromicrobium sp.]|jgi:hypothetical protein|uniref:hypothetical protein n=1 Tax=Anaeromicrobium sp. TaxID=1929132 RepID=UPI0025DC193C|nr:hypothetical protein [Anaeromicrobium sp.]MCT4594714.1 hypothetical protein [Anaeromicrobium sp.]
MRLPFWQYLVIYIIVASSIDFIDKKLKIYNKLYIKLESKILAKLVIYFVGIFAIIFMHYLNVNPKINIAVAAGLGAGTASIR